MKISRIRISSFGKLRDFSADFTPGLNCIERENEFGKSTILSFIRAMFYGFPPKSTASVKDYSRGKYMPWGTKGFGGSIVFRHEQREYILERTFFARKSEDHVALSDGKNGAQIDTGDKEIGEFLFDIGEAEFVNTVFIGQMSTGFAATGRNTESVSERLSNMAATGSETYSFDTADKHLKEASAALLALRGSGGIIRELERERDKLLEEEQQADEQMRRLEEVNNRIDTLSLQCEAIRSEELQQAIAQRSALQIQIEDAALKQKAIETMRIETLERQKYLADIIFRQHEHDKERAREALRRADYIRQIETESRDAGKELSETITMEEKCGEDYAGKQNTLLMQQSETEKLLSAAEERRREKEKAQFELQDEINTANATAGVPAGTAAGEIEEISRYRRNVLLSFTAAITLFVLAIAGAIIAVVSDRPQWMWSLMLISPAAGIFFLVFFAVSRRKKANMNRRLLIEKYAAQLEQCRKDISDAKVIEQDLRMQLETLTAQIDALSQRETLEKVHYREKRESLSSRIESLSVRLKNIRAEEQTASAADEKQKNEDTANMTAADPDEELARISGEIGRIDADVKKSGALIRALLEEDQRLKAIEDKAGEMIAACREEIAHLTGGRDKIESHIPDRSEIEEKLLLTDERINRARAYHRSLQLAGEAMKSASGEMERIFAPKVNELAGKYLSLLTGGRYSSLRFDRDFHVEVATEDDVAFRSSDYFSGGTVDQIYLALRLSISDLIHTEGDKMPLLLDDALVQYDDERAAQAMRLLVTLSAERQIILFTCHKSTSERICNIAAETGSV